MKHTYIFLATDPELSNHRLRKLVNVLRLTTTVSWKYAGNSDMLTSVQCFVDGPTAYHLLSDAGIDSDAWDNIIKAARRNGDVAVGRAEAKLNELRRRPLVPSGAHKEQKRTYKRAMHGTKATDRLNLRLTPGQKESYEDVAGKRNLSKWILRTLDRAVVAPVQMPGGTKRSQRSC